MAGDDWFISLFIHSRKEQAFQTDVFLKSFSLSTWGKLYGSLTWHLTPSVRFRSRQQNAILGLQLMAIILHKCSFFLWRPACFTCTWFRKIQPQAHGSFYVTNTHTHTAAPLFTWVKMWPSFLSHMCLWCFCYAQTNLIFSITDGCFIPHFLLIFHSFEGQTTLITFKGSKNYKAAQLSLILELLPTG